MTLPVRRTPPELVAPLTRPEVDPAPLFELFRGSFSTELLVASVAHFRVFERLEKEALSFGSLRRELGISERAMNVLITALLAMGLLDRNPRGELGLSPMARRHLLSSSPYFVGDYFGLAGASEGVTQLVERLKTDKPKGSRAEEAGVGFIFKEGIKSAMEDTSGARAFTLALAGRAKNVAPDLARVLPLSEARVLLDVGGGTGLYSIAFLRANPQLRAIVWDRPEVLRVAEEFARESGVGDRLQLLPGDMFSDPVPGEVDVVLLSNVLHDWDIGDCRRLLRRCAAGISPGGRVVVHDVFLNDALDGPLPIALYSAALFSVTEGRAYSIAEYSEMLNGAGIRPVQVLPTLVHCGALVGVRR